MIKKYIDMPTRKLNRLKSRTPKGGKGWCVCDMAQISFEQKCRICGRKPHVYVLRLKEIP